MVVPEGMLECILGPRLVRPGAEREHPLPEATSGHRFRQQAAPCDR
jgi:hypothetical protein